MRVLIANFTGLLIVLFLILMVGTLYWMNIIPAMVSQVFVITVVGGFLLFLFADYLINNRQKR